MIAVELRNGGQIDDCHRTDKAARLLGACCLPILYVAHLFEWRTMARPTALIQSSFSCHQQQKGSSKRSQTTIARCSNSIELYQVLRADRPAAGRNAKVARVFSMMSTTPTIRVQDGQTVPHGHENV